MSDCLDINNVIVDEANPIVFCFHYAGGSARVFQDWKKCSLVNYIPIELPGHGRRIIERIQNDLTSLSGDIAEEINKLMHKYSKNMKFAFFGHSLGAIIAFNVACELSSRYDRAPSALLVAGRHAPQDEDPSPYRTDMGVDVLKDEMRRLGHTPPELLDNKEFADFIMPVIYGDYQLSESYRYNYQKLQMPIYAYCGEEDTEANEEEMKHWADVTYGDFKLKAYGGDHFFIFDKKKSFESIVAKDVLKACGYMRRENININMQRRKRYERGTI